MSCSLALQFWHERIGQYIGDLPCARSFGGVYPCRTKSGITKPARIGSLAGAAVLADAQDAVLIERLAVLELPSQATDHVRIISDFDSGSYNLKRTVLEWVINPARQYPLLAALPQKRGFGAALQVTGTPDRTIVASIGEPRNQLVFDAVCLRDARQALLALNAEKHWKSASRLRAQVEGRLPAACDTATLLEQYAKACDLVPLDVWLPLPLTPEYAVLHELLSDKPALPL